MTVTLRKPLDFSGFFARPKTWHYEAWMEVGCRRCGAHEAYLACVPPQYLVAHELRLRCTACGDVVAQYYVLSGNEHPASEASRMRTLLSLHWRE